MSDTPYTTSIKIGEYILRDDGTVEMSGDNIDLRKANIINVGLITENEQWVVTLITKASILKLEKGITKNLEVIGFRFVTFEEAISAHNFLAVTLLTNIVKDNHES